MVESSKFRLPSGARRFATLCSVVIVACVALAAPVFAFASSTRRTVIVATHTKGSATSVCPKGEHVAFGGLAGEYKNRTAVLPEGARLTATDRWTVFAWNNVPNSKGLHLTSVAYCGHGGPLRVASKTVPFAGGVVTAVATCPAGTVVVGGGYNSGASIKNQEMLVQLDRRSSNQWQVTMRNFGAATTLTADAYCATGAAPKVVASAAVTLTDSLNKKPSTARATCPKGTVLVGGGLRTGPVKPLSTSFVAVLDWVAPTSTQWAVTAIDSIAYPSTLEAFAYCR